MKTSLASGSVRQETWLPVDSSQNATEVFRRQFMRSLKVCVRKGFSVEECFGLTWEETRELIPLDDEMESRLYGELIGWAKAGLP